MSEAKRERVKSSYINDNGSKKKDESKPVKEYQENPNKKKYVERQVVLGSSPFYNDYIDQLSDMLTMIGFNLISIPVSMQMSNGGFQRIGSIRSFDSYTKEFTVSVDEDAEFPKDAVMVPRVVFENSRRTDEIKTLSYITVLSIVRGEPVDIITEDFFNDDSNRK